MVTVKSLGLGIVTCPKCGKRGHFRAYWSASTRRGKINGPYFVVEHQCYNVVYSEYKKRRLKSELENVKLGYCCLSLKTTEEVNVVLALRPWPTHISDMDELERMEAEKTGRSSRENPTCLHSAQSPS